MKVLGDSLAKSKNLRVVELNATMSHDVVNRLLKDISDHAKTNGKSKSVCVVSFVKS